MPRSLVFPKTMFHAHVITGAAPKATITLYFNLFTELYQMLS